MNMEMDTAGNEKVYKILLLTNRDSDNVGDQVIEASDISLISAVMKNLNIKSENYSINSRAAGIISQKYLATKAPELLNTAEELIKNSDIVIFGGAPLFNYRYQTFYERTAVTLEIAGKYGKPVIFSAIGVEGYDENNEKCQRLKKTLNSGCVKQITTRDDFESLQKFVDGGQVKIGKVSDPAVFASKIFEKFTADKEEKEKKRVGIFILRANGFKDNGVNFSRENAAALWKEVVCGLEKKGYDYELVTSGHFGDEAFLDLLVKNYNFNIDKCVFNMNSPERLIKKISSYDAVVTCRLHPSIISFSLDVPSLGVVWNSKVRYFYESIGYADRIIDVTKMGADSIIDKIERIISEGVSKDQEYLMSVYNALFYGIRNSLCSEETQTMPYGYAELMENIPVYPGTSEKEQEEKIKRKFRRTYGKYNDVFEKNVQNKLLISELKAKAEGYTVVYNGGIKTGKLRWDYDESKGEVQILESGSVEYRLDKSVMNTGREHLLKNGFVYPGHVFTGWHMRVRDGEKWYWYLEDGTFKLQDNYKKDRNKGKYLLKDRARIPHIPAKRVATVVLEGVWEPGLKTKVVRKIKKIRGRK